MPAEPTRTRRYAQLCGIATALDVVGDRWSLLVVRELLLGPLRFSGLLEGLPGIGTNTLAARLKQLESSAVIRRRLLELPEGGTVYELTDYGRELEPILMALGRWGTRSMGRLTGEVHSRSRWLVAAMLAFHGGRVNPGAPTTWELRLSDGSFTVHADGASVTAHAGVEQAPDHVVTTSDETLHQLLTRQISPTDALARGLAEVDGGPSALVALIDLFGFPDLASVAAA